MFLGHEKSVTWSGCEFEDVESWFYTVRCLIYWNMFGMTRILLTATAPSVRGWEILFDYTHIKKKKQRDTLLPVNWVNFPTYPRLLTISDSYKVPTYSQLPSPPLNYWTNTCTFLHSEQKLGSKTRYSYKRRMQW